MEEAGKHAVWLKPEPDTLLRIPTPYTADPPLDHVRVFGSSSIIRGYKVTPGFMIK